MPKKDFKQEQAKLKRKPMKNFKYLLLASTILFFITSCSKDEGNPNSNQNPISNSTIKGKWSISGETNMLTLELTEKGNYIVQEKGAQARKATTSNSGNTKTVFFVGKFEIVNENTVNLIDYKILKNFKVVNNVVHFTLENKQIKATKVKATIENSSKTELLCNGEWNFKKRIEIVTDLNGHTTTRDTSDELKGSSIIFTVNGTYIMYDNKETIRNNWKWKGNDLEISNSDGSKMIGEVTKLSEKQIIIKFPIVKSESNVGGSVVKEEKGFVKIEFERK